MFFSTIMHLENIFKEEFVQSIELIITFVSLFGIIFYLLMTAGNKKYFQKQK